MTDTPEAAVSPSIVVTGGGTPTAAELAALVIALTPVVVVEDDGTVEPDSVVRGWRHAALIEGVGGRAAVSHPDLRSGRFGLGHAGDPTLLA